jgi:hypothetical protein
MNLENFIEENYELIITGEFITKVLFQARYCDEYFKAPLIKMQILE